MASQKGAVTQFHCMEMNWSSLLALVLLAYFVVSMLFTGVFLLLAVKPGSPSLPSMENLPTQQRFLWAVFLFKLF